MKIYLQNKLFYLQQNDVPSSMIFKKLKILFTSKVENWDELL